MEGFYRAHGFDVLGVGEKIVMHHLGPAVQTGSDDSERMVVRHRGPGSLPWGDLLAAH
ncbi:hypothetical protein ACIGW8_38310 [Streptomyces sioyaensis]|uniref:hypothetical protein n=1 Tax=Streptomyces sioyaensis TaxID=67364 RepID=UPI0037D49A7D